MNIFQNAFYVLGSVAIFGLILMIGLGQYWQYKPYKIQDYQNPIPILNTDHIIRPGDTILWQIDVTNYGSYSYTNTTEILPASGQNACDYKILRDNEPGTISVDQLGHRTAINSSFVLPAGFRPCKYFIQLTTIYTVNPNRKITIVKRTEDFTVQ